ncbi:MAG: hypothetical protein H7257_09820 [Taibaiella sp.]|nr:hypothetical protein [Taibaiella sp.]
MAEQKTKDQLPGYPHYPANEDITKSTNNSGVVRPDAAAGSEPYNNIRDNRGEEKIMAGTDADVTADDIKMLEAADQNMNTIDSINLQHASLDTVDDEGDPLNESGSFMEDMTGDDLDVPSAMADDAGEKIGEEDEENNYYSLGGDNHESQEESKE